MAWASEDPPRTERPELPVSAGRQAHEIVGVAPYLASDASSFTTGSILEVDGGVAYASS
jgi:NAD(P)-dependent dehydrogenase (short-subunit alcohol dehydrogenase family)